jgi:nicotinamide-nucleotide amidase
MHETADRGRAAVTRADDIADQALCRGIRIAVAESLTCGLLASELGKGHDAAEWFAGGVVAYRRDVKERVLGVHPGVDPCSEECAEQLAAGVRGLLDADVAVSATGVGGPDPEDGHRPGTVYLGWSAGVGVGHLLLQLEGDPEDVLAETVAQCVSVLEELLEAAG